MTSFVYSLLAFIVAIGVLVVVHEFGHFWVARSLGIKVLRFSIGFGKPLWTRRFGVDQTELVIAALPLGGYVKMLDETEGKVPKKDLDRAFNRQPLWKRGAVVLAGPMFNFLFAILAYWGLFTVGIEGVKPVVGQVIAGSIAQKAGFQVGDVILSIDGKPTQSWDQRRLYLFEKALDKAQVSFEVRDTQGKIETHVLDMSGLSANQISSGMLEKVTGLYGYSPEIAPIVGSVLAGSPAAKAGLQHGDRIVSIDGQPIRSWEDVITRISTNPGRSIALIVDRAGAQVEFHLTPEVVESDGKQVGRIGVGVLPPEVPASMRVLVRSNPLRALAEGVNDTWLMTTLTLKMLVKMVELRISTHSISGPITIAQYAGYSAQIGFGRFLMFLAVISISLGVLNLLPVPVLDGGHLLVYLIEAVKGGPLPERVMYWSQQVGIMFLVALMALAFYNDFMRLLH
ncbi:MAG: RIP metalloprotease RseP [Acidiferrobacterales bacterium]